MTYPAPRTRALSRTLILGAAALALALTGCSAPQPESETGSAQAALPANAELHAALPASVQESGVLRLGSPTTNAPYITKPTTDVEGLIPELAAAVGEVLGVEVEFVDTPFPGLVPALGAQRIDAIWTVMNDTAEREETMQMVDWIKSDSGFLVTAGNPDQLNRIEDFCGHAAGTLRGSAQAELLEATSADCAAAGKSPIEIKLYEDMGAGQTQLRSGNLAGYFGGTVPLRYLASQVDGGTAFEVMDQTYLGGVFAIAVPLEDTEFANALVAALAEVEAAGAYGEILDAYEAGADALSSEEFQVNGVGAGAFG